jgi:hypothetical protein
VHHVGSTILIYYDAPSAKRYELKKVSPSLSVRSTSNAAWIFMQYFFVLLLLKFVGFIHIWLKWVTKNRPLPQRHFNIHPKHDWEILSDIFKGKWTIHLCFTLFRKFCGFQDTFTCILYNGAFSLWDVTWHRLVVSYWCFGIICQSHLQL